MAISTTSFPEGSDFDSLLQNAMQNWNNVSAMDFRFYVARDTDGVFATDNGVNEIGAGPLLSSFGALAVTYSRYHCIDRWIFGWDRAIDEADILFESGIDWSVAPLDYANIGRLSFEGVALHELGHALGLKHQDGLPATMNTRYPNGGPLGDLKQWVPLPDDREGGRALYTGGNRETDIAASVFKWPAAGGNSVFVSSPDVGSRGTNVTIELTFHNLGTQPATFNIGFYLSNDDRIGTNDILLGANNGAWANPGGSLTFARTLFIPSGISPGRYWLGFILDYDDRLSETKESNNAAALPRPITIN